jgi:hypothetical protein
MTPEAAEIDLTLTSLGKLENAVSGRRAGIGLKEKRPTSRMAMAEEK